MPPEEPTQSKERASFLFSAPVYPDYDPKTAPEQAARAAAARQRYDATPPAGDEAEPAPEPLVLGAPSATPDAGATASAVTSPATLTVGAASGPVPVVQSIPTQSFDFQDELPRNVLTSYLARAMQMEGMCTDYVTYAPSTGLRAGHPTPSLNLTQAKLDDILTAEANFILDVGAKFIGRVAGWWGQWGSDLELERLRVTAEYLHGLDAQLVLQACVFEYIDRGVQDYYYPGWVGTPIPQWAWEEFYPGQPYRQAFNVYDAANPNAGMLFSDSYNTTPGHTLGNGYFLDITRTETKMWVYWRAVRYLDAGCEAIHFGQVNVTGSSDPSNEHWWDVLTRIRNYAAGRKGPYYDNILGRNLKQWPAPAGWRGARRGVVFCDAHTYGLLLYRPGTAHEFQLLFDFHSFPLRPSDRPENNSPLTLPTPDVELRAGYGGAYGGAIYGRSAWGYAPIPPYEFHAGAPFLAEFDNMGRDNPPSPLPSVPAYVRSYDEISWFGGGQASNGAVFALQPPLATGGIWTLNYGQVDEPIDNNNPLGLAHEFLPNANYPGTSTSYRDWYLRYFWQQVRRLDDNGWFQVPGRRGVGLGGFSTSDPRILLYPQGIGFLYRAYDATPALAALNLPSGYGGQQATIRGLFSGQASGWGYDPLRPDPNNPTQSISWANVAGDLFTDSTGKIFYRSTDNRLWLFYRHFDASNTVLEWSQVSINDGTVGPQYNVGGSLAFDEPRRRIYYLTNSNPPQICNFEYGSTGWRYQNMGSLASAPSWFPADYAPAGILLPDSTGKLFYITQNGHVCTCFDAGTSWYHVVLDWNAPLAAGELTIAPNGRLFYRGLDGRIHSLTYIP